MWNQLVTRIFYQISIEKLPSAGSKETKEEERKSRRRDEKTINFGKFARELSQDIHNLS